jgi:hypothetical protein
MCHAIATHGHCNSNDSVPQRAVAQTNKYSYAHIYWLQRYVEFSLLACELACCHRIAVDELPSRREELRSSVATCVCLHVSCSAHAVLQPPPIFARKCTQTTKNSETRAFQYTFGQFMTSRVLDSLLCSAFAMSNGPTRAKHVTRKIQIRAIVFANDSRRMRCNKYKTSHAFELLMPCQDTDFIESGNIACGACNFTYLSAYMMHEHISSARSDASSSAHALFCGKLDRLVQWRSWRGSRPRRRGSAFTTGCRCCRMRTSPRRSSWGFEARRPRATSSRSGSWIRRSASCRSPRARKSLVRQHRRTSTTARRGSSS